jgi:hypothetical protein
VTKDPQYVINWPPKLPLVLIETQSDDLGLYITCDSTCLYEVGFAKPVDKQQGQFNFHPSIRKL